MKEPRFVVDHFSVCITPGSFEGAGEGLIKFSHQVKKAPFSCIEDDNDQGWQGTFLCIRTEDLIPLEFMSFMRNGNQTVGLLPLKLLKFFLALMLPLTMCPM